MANRLQYYYKQKVSESELNQGFDFLEKADRNLVNDLGIFGIIDGMIPMQHQPVADLSIDLSAPGIGYDQLGQRLFYGNVQTIDLSVDSDGNRAAVTQQDHEKWLSVWIKFARFLHDERMDGYSKKIFFHHDESLEFIVRQGQEAPAGTATRPALMPDEVLICDVRLTHNQTQIVDGDIHIDRRQFFEFTQADKVKVLTALFKILNPNSINVQYALESADQELGKIINAVNNHTQAQVDVHPAAAITNASSGNLTATTVQEAINELDKEKATSNHQHLASEVAVTGETALADGSTIGKQDLETALNQLVQLLADKTTPGSDGAARIGAEAQHNGTSAVSRGSISSQILELLQLLSNKGDINTDNMWKETQVFAGAPALLCPETTSMRELLYVRSPTTPLRMYFDGNDIWITINARWESNQWNADNLIGMHSALQMGQDNLALHFQVGNMPNWTQWHRTWSWNLGNGITHPVVTNGVEEGFWALQVTNPQANNQAHSLGYGVNFKATFPTSPSSITLIKDGEYNWSGSPSVTKVTPHGFVVYGTSDVLSQGTSALAYGRYKAW